MFGLGCRLVFNSRLPTIMSFNRLGIYIARLYSPYQSISYKLQQSTKFNNNITMNNLFHRMHSSKHNPIKYTVTVLQIAVIGYIIST